MAPATNGTLSTMADSNPIMIFIIKISPLKVSSKNEATLPKVPMDCKPCTASKIPKKKKIVKTSIFLQHQ